MGDEVGLCGALGNLAGALNELGDTERATDNFRQALEIGERLGLKRNLGYIRSGLGHISSDRGEYADGAEHFAASLTAFHECGAPAEMANVLGSLAEMADTLGDPVLGARLFGASRGIRDAIGTDRSRIRSRTTSGSWGWSARERAMRHSRRPGRPVWQRHSMRSYEMPSR